MRVAGPWDDSDVRRISFRQPQNAGRCMREFVGSKSDAREYGEPTPRPRWKFVTPLRARRGQKDNSAVTVNEQRQRRRNRQRHAIEERLGCPFTEALSNELWKNSGEPEKMEERQQQKAVVAEDNYGYPYNMPEYAN